MALNNGNPQTPVSIDCQDNPAGETPVFKISHQILADLLQDNDSNSLQPFGGMQGIMAALETNVEKGIRGDAGDLHRRRRSFGSNLYMEEKPVVGTAAFVRLSQKYLKDTTIILLLCCALLSAVIEIKRNGVVEGLIDGAIIFSAVSFVIFLGLVRRYIQSTVRRRRLMMKKKNLAAAVCVIRCGKMLRISDSEVVAGDIVCLHAGSHIPADGFFVDGDSLFKLDDEGNFGLVSTFKKNPCLFTGAKVKTGRGRMLVVSVGNNTERSRLMRSVMRKNANQESRLQISIDKTNSGLERILLSLTLLVLVLELFRCFLSNSDKCDDTKDVKNTVQDLMHEWTKLMKNQVGIKGSGLITFLSVLIFALRDGLPLGVFVTCVYAKRKIRCYGAVVRNLSACAMIGLTTTVCIGVIADDLALNPSEMADLWIGFDWIKDVSVELQPQVLQLLQDGLSAYVSCPGGHGSSDAISYWARQELGEQPNQEKEEIAVLHIHCSGEQFEEILSICSHYLKRDGSVECLVEDRKGFLKKQFQQIASINGLQVLAFAFYKHPNQDDDEDEEDGGGGGEETLCSCKQGFIFLALVSLKNPYRPEMRRTIQDFQASGVSIKLAVETDIATARIQALYSGILRPQEDSEGAVIEAFEFRKRDEEERMKMIENIHVIANASPVDKLQFVQCLKQKNKVVAFSSSCTRDSPTLKEADVGFFVGDVDFSHQDSDVIVLNKNVSTVFNVVRLGRCVNESVKWFVQLQLSLNITAFTVNFISAIAKKEAQLIFPFQVLWINLAMDVLGALALAIVTVECTRVNHTCTLNGEDDPIITRTDWRNIVVQSSFQVAILVIVEMKLGRVVFHKVDESVLKTMISGCYVFCQVFSLITAMMMMLKKKEEKIRVFEGLLVNIKIFLILCIVGSIAFLEVGFVDIMSIVAHWGSLSSMQWCICVGIAAVSMSVTTLFSVYTA